MSQFASDLHGLEQVKRRLMEYFVVRRRVYLAQEV
jgi:hypothetical protein